MYTQQLIRIFSAFLVALIHLTTAKHGQSMHKVVSHESPCLQPCTTDNNLPSLSPEDDLYVYRQTNATNYKSELAVADSCDSYYWGTLNTHLNFTYEGIRTEHLRVKNIKSYHFRNMKPTKKHVRGKPALLYCELPDGDYGEDEEWPLAQAWPIPNKCSLIQSGGKWKPACSFN